MHPTTAATRAAVSAADQAVARVPVRMWYEIS
ncbi:MAG: hypothetical protein ACI91T_001392, partial [Natronomonas sp.]